MEGKKHRKMPKLYSEAVKNAIPLDVEQMKDRFQTLKRLDTCMTQELRPDHRFHHRCVSGRRLPSRMRKEKTEKYDVSIRVLQHMAAPLIVKKRARSRSKSSRRQKKIDEKEKPIVILLFQAE